jgi:phosphoglycerol transferase
MRFISQNFLYSILAGIGSVIIFILSFQLWRVDFSIPFFHNEADALLYLFIIKSIVSHGWIFSNPDVGMPNLSSIYSLNNHPQHSEFFNLVIVKFLNLFTDNIFLIENLFFLITFFLISTFCFIALRVYKISVFTSFLIAILYGFLPYHFERNLCHLFLSNYAIIPLYSLVIIWIYEEKIKFIGLNKNHRFCLTLNKYFYLSSLIVFFSCLNGFYYACFGIMAIGFSYILFSLKKGNFFNRNFLNILFLIFIFFVVTIYINIPTIVGFFKDNAIPHRGYNDSYIYGIKIINLFLPIENHYFEFLAKIKIFFNVFVDNEMENSSASLGIVGATGFLFSLLWLLLKNNNNSFYVKTVKRFFLKEEDCDKISFLASMNFLSILFLSAGGGLIMFILVGFPFLRSNARFVVFIAFFSFVIIGIIFDKIIAHKFFKTTNKSKLFVMIIAILAFGDQVGISSFKVIQPTEIIDQYQNDQDFVDEIEKSLPINSSVFVLPFFGYPEETNDYQRGLIGYLYSRNLKWSYPVNKKSKTLIWQNKVFYHRDFNYFIAQLKKNGFSGVYLDKDAYLMFNEVNIKAINLYDLENKLKKYTKYPVIYSRDKVQMFVRID